MQKTKLRVLTQILFVSILILFVKIGCKEEITGKYKPVKISNEDKENHFKNMEQLWKKYFDQSVIKRIKKATPFPKEKPAYSGFLIDNTGYILVNTYRRDKKKGTECDIYDFTGKFIRKIYLHYSKYYPKYMDKEIYSIVTPKDDFPRVVRLKMVRVK